MLRLTKIQPLMRLAANKANGRGDSQPSCGACLRPISSVASATAINVNDVRSSFLNSAKLTLSLGSRNGVAAAASKPGATLIRNSQCQDHVSVIQPPTMGPTVGASTATIPANVVASGCRRSGNNRNTAEKTAGISAPPAKPCSTRNEISVEKLSDNAQPIEAIVNRLI